MGDSPTTDNKAVDFVDGLIQALMDGGAKAGEVYITALDPALLGNPFVQYLLDEGVEWVEKLVVAALMKSGDNLVIDIQTNGEQSAIIKAASALRFAEASKDKDAIQKAVQSMAAAYGKAIHFDGISQRST